MTRLLSLLAIGALGVLVAGCGGSHCDDEVTCGGGNDADKEACELQVEALYDQAEIDGCTDLVDAWQDCLSDAECSDGTFGKTCRDREKSMDECIGGSGAEESL